MDFVKSLKNRVPATVKRRVARTLHRTRFQKKSVFESFLDHVEQGDIVISVPDLKGKFWIDIRSHLVRRVVVNGYYEPDVTKALVSNLSGDFIDVGANVGFYSVHLANQDKFTGKVLALEPNQRAFDYLKRNIDANELAGRVELRELAASSNGEDLHLTTIAGLEEYSTVSDSLHPGMDGQEVEKVVVKSDTIDNLVAEFALNPGLIKIDAEGAEMDVLNGMKKTLSEYRPVLVCEIGGSTFGSDVDSVRTFFSDLNYSLYRLSGEPVDMKDNTISEVIAKPNQ